MKRTVVLVLVMAIIAFLLIACQSVDAGQSEPTLLNSEPNEAAQQEGQTTPTFPQDSTGPETTPTEMTVPISATPSEFPVRSGGFDWTAAVWYGFFAPDGLSSSILPQEIASQCVEGFLYAYNEKTSELRLILDQTVIDRYCTPYHIYYVTEQEPDAIYRTDFAGEQHELVCQIHGAQLEIDGLLYYQDQLSLAIIISGRQAALYHIDNEKWTVFMEQAYILKFGFDCETDPYRLMICWHGRVSEDEEGIHPYKTYLDTGETVDWNYL